MATCAWHYILPRAMKVLGERSMVCCGGVGVVVYGEWMFVMAASHATCRSPAHRLCQHGRCGQP